MSRRRKQISATSFLRRRSTRWLIGGLVLLAVAGILSAISRNGAGPHQVSEATVTVVATQPASLASPSQTQPRVTPPVTIVTPPGISPDPALLTRATVTHVVDGDTIDVVIDGSEERVRYYGIDTPERGVACFTEATVLNRELVGQTVLLLSDARDRDRYGRLLRYVFDADGDSVDAQLIAEGLARAWREDGAYRDQLLALEVEADRANAGCLWR